MKCSRCGLTGHNARSIEKCILENFDKMNTLVTTGYFYTRALNILFMRNERKICMVNNHALRWRNGDNYIENIHVFYNELVLKFCKKKFVFFPLFISSKEGNHANGILINHINKTIIRIEPHGASRDMYRRVEEIIMKNILYSGYILIPVQSSCPYLGIQSRFYDKHGLCQVSTIYYLDAIINNDKDMLKIRNAKETKYILFDYLIRIIAEHTLTAESLFKKDDKYYYSKLMLQYNNLNEIDKNYVHKFFPDRYYYLGFD